LFFFLLSKKEKEKEIQKMDERTVTTGDHSCCSVLSSHLHADQIRTFYLFSGEVWIFM
jgi:hypothetical protein